MFEIIEKENYSNRFEVQGKIKDLLENVYPILITILSDELTIDQVKFAAKSSIIGVGDITNFDLDIYQLYFKDPVKESGKKPVLIGNVT